jgi:hypothetical protein
MRRFYPTIARRESLRMRAAVGSRVVVVLSARGREVQEGGESAFAEVSRVRDLGPTAAVDSPEIDAAMPPLPRIWSGDVKPLASGAPTATRSAVSNAAR